MRKYNRPVEVSIELSQRCPLKCIHCSSEGMDNVDTSNELSHEEWLDVIEQAGELRTHVLSISGGEPLVYPKIFDILEYAKLVDVGKILLYTTGCVGINDDGTPIMMGIDSKFMEYNIGSITSIFSLHSPDPRTHDSIVGINGMWKEETKLIKQIADRGGEVWVHTVPMRYTYAALPDMRELCDELGVTKMSALRFVPQGRGADTRLATTHTQFLHMQRILADMVEDNPSHIAKIRLGCPIDFRFLLGGYNTKKKCHAGDMILVRPDGSVHPCAAWKTLPTTLNVKDHSLHTVWEDCEVLNFLRDFHENPICAEDCQHVELCGGGCLAQRLHSGKGEVIEDLITMPPDPLCGHS